MSCVSEINFRIGICTDNESDRQAWLACEIGPNECWRIFDIWNNYDDRFGIEIVQEKYAQSYFIGFRNNTVQRRKTVFFFTL